MKSLSVLIAALSLAGCTAYPYTPPALAPVTRPSPAATIVAAPVPDARAPVTILVSIDGFRPDYLDRGASPNLARLAAGGVLGSMRPSFPSKTFPNHWTLVTGLVPDRHGIVGNTMEDSRRPGEVFKLATTDPFWWNAAEPLWVAAERAGIRTATEFWPGASVAWGSTASADRHGITAGGTRPTDWHAFDANITDEARVDAVLDWMRRPQASRPRFVTLYFDQVDSAGHDEGPDGRGVTRAVAAVDAAIGRLSAGLAALDQPANIVVVADHGMAATSSERVVALDRIADAADFRTVETGPYASVQPQPGHEADLARALLRPHPHMACWAKAAIPARLRYGKNPRVPAYLCLADDGWQVLRTMPTTSFIGGEHGYDNALPSMRAVFIANGPAFRSGARLATFDNVDVAPLLRDLIGLPPGQALDGSDAPFRKVLK
jgi:predicted AlkP superfamily pyrophosphatase or phosphodiesterase